MQIAHELHIDEDEVAAWSQDKFARWVAYFKLRQEDEKKAADRARRGSKGKFRGSSRNITSAD